MRIGGREVLTADLEPGGRIAFWIYTQGLPPGSGARAFSAMIAHFGERARSVEGRWGESSPFHDNWDTYRSLVGEGYAPAGAAALTFTGKMAGRHGFMIPVVVIAADDEAVIEFHRSFAGTPLWFDQGGGI